MKAPKTRGECRNGLRPCPWIRCKYHLIWDITLKRLESYRWVKFGRNKGQIYCRWPLSDDEVVDMIVNMNETCALDIAERGGSTLQEVGDVMNITRERVRQIEGLGHPNKTNAIKKLRHRKRAKYLEPFTR